MGQTYLARPGAGHGNSWPRPEASGARPRSRALSLPSVRSPASHKPVGVGGATQGIGREAMSAVPQGTATGPVQTRTQWTRRRHQSCKIPAKQRNNRTHQDGLECISWLLYGGGQGFESPRLHFCNMLICRRNVERE